MWSVQNVLGYFIYNKYKTNNNYYLQIFLQKTNEVGDPNDLGIF